LLVNCTLSGGAAQRPTLGAVACAYMVAGAKLGQPTNHRAEGLQLVGKYDAFIVSSQHNDNLGKREGIPMSICFSGLDTPCYVHPVTIDVSPTHPLIQLARVIPWQALADMVLPDLKRTTAKGHWWLGRKLRPRLHLGALLLQWLYHLPDRQVEWAIKDNAAYQLFCGQGLVDPWYAPDHTKIEEFRSRLSPETQRQMANVVAVWATELGFADPSAMDIDSTVQEANIAYPSDAHLIVKMVLLVNKVWTYMKQNIAFFADFIPQVDVKAVKAKARAYLFRDRQDAEQAQTKLQALWHEAFTHEFIPLKSSVATGSGAPGSCGGRSRVPSRDHGRPPSTGGCGL
jgi:transposase, IS5 family